MSAEPRETTHRVAARFDVLRVTRRNRLLLFLVSNLFVLQVIVDLNFRKAQNASPTPIVQGTRRSTAPHIAVSSAPEWEEIKPSDAGLFRRSAPCMTTMLMALDGTRNALTARQIRIILAIVRRMNADAARTSFLLRSLLANLSKQQRERVDGPLKARYGQVDIPTGTAVHGTNPLMSKLIALLEKKAAVAKPSGAPKYPRVDGETNMPQLEVSHALMGIYALEMSRWPISPEQAKDLLPFVKELRDLDPRVMESMDAVARVLSPQQVRAIENMPDISREEMATRAFVHELITVEE